MGFAVIALGIAVVLGWLTDNEALKRVQPGFTTMNPLTAVCFIASGGALLLSGRWRVAQQASKLLAVLIFATVSLQLFTEFAETKLQIDEVLFTSAVKASMPPSAMATSTALGFLLGAVAQFFVCSTSVRSRIAAQYFAFALAFVALFAGVAYAYGANVGQIWRPFQLMALHTAWGLFILAAGILLRDPSVGLMALFLSQGSAGRTLRLMIPIIVLVPVMLGWLAVGGARSEWFGTSLAVTFVSVASMMLLLVAVVAAARMILKYDEEKQVRLDAVRASEERLSGILSIAADAIISIDADQKITLFNAWAEKIFGYGRDEIMGKPLEVLLPERFRAAHSTNVENFGREVVKARRMGERSQIFARKKDGTTFPAEASISKLQIDGQPIYTVVLRDMTEQWRTAEALVKAKNDAEAAAHSKSEFLANMSHELRTPLNSISGFTQLLLADESLEQTRRTQLKKIKDAASALTTIVNDILDYSKLEEGMLTLSMSNLSPEALVANCISIVDTVVEARELEIAAVLDPSVKGRFYLGDPNRIQQILLNLLSNAVKFTNQGKVTLTVEEEASDDETAWVRFAVMDTGIGIPPDQMARLFRRFSQVDGSISRNYGGTGLGLAICKLIVTLMGGQIGVESEPGKGSTFWFRLPMERAAAPIHQERESGRERQQKAEAWSILLVEDVELNREIATAMLEREGHLVDVACDGAQAVRKVADSTYDLVLMDIQMPVMDGVTATRQIRALKGSKSRVPILAMTANVLPDEVDRFYEAGMNGHIRKPVDREELIRQVDRWASNGDRAVA